MPFSLRVRRRAPACLALCAALTACGDRAGPLAPPLPAAPAPTPVLLATLSCQARLAPGTVTCGDAPMPSALRGYIIVGGQGTFVQVATSGVAYDASTGAFTFNATVKNLIAQPMGTTDGATPDAGGVKVVFTAGPTVTGGSGNASVTGDGTGAFDHAGEPYYQYSGGQLGGDGILSSGETSSARGWTLNVDNTVSTFAFQLYVVAEVPHPSGYVDVSPAAPNVLAGGTRALTAVVRTAAGTPIPGQTVTWGTDAPSIATVDAGGTVSGLAPGNATITATSGARTGSVALGVCPDLAVGQVYFPTAATYCAAGGAAGAEFTIMPVNLGGTGSSIYLFTPTGNVAVTGPPNPDRAAAGSVVVPARPVPDEAFHDALLKRSREGFMALGGARALVRGRAGGPRRSITPGVPAVGSTMSLNVSQNFCSPVDMRTATVKSVGAHIILLEDNANPVGGFSTAQYDNIAADFDTLAYPVDTDNFGAPSDIDGNGRVLALYTAAVNDLTPAGSGSYIGGFYYSRDLASTASCAGSNQGEMFYMLAPDPTGAHGDPRTAGFVDSVTVGTLAHEFQHLINASRRIYGPGGPYPQEQVWLNEGLSHIAEELLYYRVTGHAPGQNLGIADIDPNPAGFGRFLQFGEANIGRLLRWTAFPGPDGPFRQVDDLAVRGSAWAFLRYAADRKGGVQASLWNALAFSPDTGMTNLTHGLGTDGRAWVRDWAVAMYLDDTGASPAAEYVMPSWNFRSVYGGLNYGGGAGYKLQTANLFSGFARSSNLTNGGGASYNRLGVAAGAFASITGTVPTASLPVALMRTK